MSAELELLLRRYAEEEDRATAAVTAGEATARARHAAALDAGERTDRMRSGRLGVRRRQGARALAVSIVALAAGAATLVFVLGGPNTTRQVETRSSSTSGGDPLDVPSGWSKLPASPLSSRIDPLLTWTGTELVVFGGYSSQAALADGATYDPRNKSWTMLSDAPIAAGSNDGYAVWDGNRVLVWRNAPSEGGGDRPGAAYDPATGRWSPLAAAPPGPNYPQLAVWTGTDVLTWRASPPSGTTDPVNTVAWAYSPETDTWRAIAPGPLDVADAVGVWDGTELILLGWRTNAPNGIFPAGGEHLAAAYDPSLDRWRELSRPPFNVETSGLAIAAAWDGTKVVAWNSELHAAALDPATGRWEPLADIPLEAGECYPDAALAGPMVFAYYCGQGASFHPDTSTWSRIATPFQSSLPAYADPRLAGPVSAGENLLFWGTRDNAPPTSTNQGWIYHPQD